MSSSTPSSVLDLSNSDLFSPQKDTSEFIIMPRFEFLTKSSPIHSLEQEIEIKEEMEVKEEQGEQFLRKESENLKSSSSTGSDEVDDNDDGFRTPEIQIPMEQNCPAAPIKPKPTVPFLTRKRKSSNVKFLFRFDLAKEIQESLLHQHPNSHEFSRIIKKVRTV